MIMKPDEVTRTIQEIATHTWAAAASDNLLHERVYHILIVHVFYHLFFKYITL